MLSRASFLRMFAATSVSVALQRTARSATWPSQPIKLVVPFAAGGPTDAVARFLAENLRRVLGQSVVVENRAGAQGAVGTVAVKDAQPDGYTLLLHEIPGTFAILPAMTPKPSYDGKLDFTPISMVASGPIFLLVRSDLPAKNLEELVAYSKTVPGGINYGSSGGMGQMPTHMGPEIFKLKSGLIARNIVYRGASPALVDLAAGRVDFMMTTGLGAAMGFLDSGKVRVLAVTSRERQPFYKDAPTFAESGFAVPELENGTIFGLLGPAGLPPDIVATLSEAVRKVLASAEFEAQLGPLMMAPFAKGGPEVLAHILDSEISSWVPVVRKLNLQSN